MSMNYTRKSIKPEYSADTKHTCVICSPCAHWRWAVSESSEHRLSKSSLISLVLFLGVWTIDVTGDLELFSCRCVFQADMWWHEVDWLLAIKLPWVQGESCLLYAVLHLTHRLLKLSIKLILRLKQMFQNQHLKDSMLYLLSSSTLCCTRIAKAHWRANNSPRAAINLSGAKKLALASV